MRKKKCIGTMNIGFEEKLSFLSATLYEQMKGGYWKVADS